MTTNKLWTTTGLLADSRCEKNKQVCHGPHLLTNDHTLVFYPVHLYSAPGIPMYVQATRV